MTPVRTIRRRAAAAITGDWPPHVPPLLQRVYAARGACDLDSARPRLSRLHAVVYLHRGRVWAADLHSQNGTLFQGRALQPGVPMPFPPGGQTAVFTLYNRNIAVKLGAATAP